MNSYPSKIFHWIAGREVESNDYFAKINPADEKKLADVARGNRAEADQAVKAAVESFEAWAGMSVNERAEVLDRAIGLIEQKRDELAEIVALEFGESKKGAQGEIDAAIKCGKFFAAIKSFEPEILESSLPNRSLRLERQPAGVGVLIVPFNNPAAGVAWKIFPALLCGNTVVLKSHEDTPYVGVWFAKIFQEAGLPDGVFDVVQGVGPEIGQALVENPKVGFISFTGSSRTGSAILKASADRMVKVSIESGGKNPIVVCADADLDKAVAGAVSASFIDAGQRCAAASRIIVVEQVYDEFKKHFLEKVKTLKVGVADDANYGAIINERRMQAILDAVKGAVSRGATLLCGGERLKLLGFFIAPTVLEGVLPDDEISRTEVFGPVPVLYRVRDFEEAVALANHSDYKLSSAIFTESLNRAEEFIKRMRVGVVRVNAPTYGSEPHVPFGGLGLSGNGWREPGRQALDFYSELKQVSIDYHGQS